MGSPRPRLGARLVGSVLGSAICIGAASCTLEAPTAESTIAPKPSEAAVFVGLTYGNGYAMVNAATLPREIREGAWVVPLSVIWAAGKLKGDPTSLVFETGDGFRASSQDDCKQSLAGTHLGKGHLVLATRTLVWDDAHVLPGSCVVRSLTKMIARDDVNANGGRSGPPT